jgi:hypothetical protein
MEMWVRRENFANNPYTVRHPRFRTVTGKLRRTQLDDRIANHTDAVRIGKYHEALQKARFLHPCAASYFSIAVKGIDGRRHWGGDITLTERREGRDTGTGTPLAMSAAAARREQPKPGSDDYMRAGECLPS